MALQIKKLQITATAESPVRVGGARDPNHRVDLPMASVAGRPVIPGPSLKGALRAQIERYLLGLSKVNPGLKPCIPASKPSKVEKTLDGYREGGACSAQVEEQTENEKKQICPACYLLGAQGLEGFVRVPFLVSSISQKKLVSIPIDRGSGTVRGGGMLTYEFAPTNTKFTGILEIILADSARGWELGKPRLGFEKQDGWLANGEWTAERIEQQLVKERLESIQILGGFKSKGFGKVKITVEPVK